MAGVVIAVKELVVRAQFDDDPPTSTSWLWFKMATKPNFWYITSRLGA